MGIGPPYCPSCTTPEELQAEQDAKIRSQAMQKLSLGLSSLNIDFTANYQNSTVEVSQDVYDFLGPRQGLVLADKSKKGTNN